MYSNLLHGHHLQFSPIRNWIFIGKVNTGDDPIISIKATLWVALLLLHLAIFFCWIRVVVYACILYIFHELDMDLTLVTFANVALL